MRLFSVEMRPVSEFGREPLGSNQMVGRVVSDPLMVTPLT